MSKKINITDVERRANTREQNVAKLQTAARTALFSLAQIMQSVDYDDYSVADHVKDLGSAVRDIERIEAWMRNQEDA